MNDFVLDSVEYIRQNYNNIQENIINILFIIYVFYGFLLALDAKRRYNSKFAPFVVFSGWILFSIFFLPIYLVVRPERLTHSKRTESDQFNALVLGSQLNTCKSCHEVIELNDKFCRSCGAKVLLKCPNCKQICSRNDKFCKNCGVKFKLKQDKKPKIVREIIKFINSTSAKIEKERTNRKKSRKDENKKQEDKQQSKDKDQDKNRDKDKDEDKSQQKPKAIAIKENGDKNLPVKVGKDSFEEIRKENKNKNKNEKKDKKKKEEPKDKKNKNKEI